MLGSGATKKVQVYKGQTDRRQCERCELGCESRGPELRMDEEKYEMRQDVVEPEMRTRTQNTDMKLCTQGFFFSMCLSHTHILASVMLRSVIELDLVNRRLM